MKKFILVCALSTLLPINSFAVDASKTPDLCKSNGIDYDAATSFAHSIRTALRSNNPEQMAALISFPLRINDVSTVNNKPTTTYIDSKEDFITRYPTIFTDTVKNSLLNYKGIFCSFQTVSIGNGTAWFSLSSTGGKIFAVNDIS
jgi:hypothetical protein